MNGGPAENSRFEEYRRRVAGTTIDDKTLLSTDYFNSFNEIVMLLGMVGDMPEMIDDIDGWRFRTYAEHFSDSGLSFGPLAIEAYPHAPAAVRERFERLIEELKASIDEVRDNLRRSAAEPDAEKLRHDARSYSRRLQNLIEKGSAIVHGSETNIDQSAVDRMF